MRGLTPIQSDTRTLFILELPAGIHLLPPLGNSVRSRGHHCLHKLKRALQVSETVRIRRCERQVFGNAEWQRLKDDLGAWRDNLHSIEVTMKEQTLLTPTSTVQRWLSS